jgi:hypothetical protein
MGVDFHVNLYNHLKRLVVEKTINPEDINLFLYTDSVEEAIAHINRYAIEEFGLKKKKKIKPLRFLGELKLTIPGIYKKVDK